VDDVMNVSGHRVSSAEVESALSHPPLPKRRSSANTTRIRVRRYVLT
jgi:hypothetical protein